MSIPCGGRERFVPVSLDDMQVVDRGRQWNRTNYCFQSPIAEAKDKIAAIRDEPDQLPSPLVDLMFEHCMNPFSLRHLIEEAMNDCETL